MEADKKLLEKFPEVVVIGVSNVFTRKAVVHETFIRKSTNICKSIVQIYASQLYPYSMRQPMRTGLYTHWDIDPETNRFSSRQSKTQSFEKKNMSFFQWTKPDCKIESFYKTGRQELIASVEKVFVFVATLILNPLATFINFVLVKKFTVSHWGGYWMC